MARPEGTKTVAFTPDEIEALGLSGAEDFSASVKELLKKNDDSLLAGFDVDLQEILKYRANGVGATIPEVLNAMARQATH